MQMLRDTISFAQEPTFDMAPPLVVDATAPANHRTRRQPGYDTSESEFTMD